MTETWFNNKEAGSKAGGYLSFHSRVNSTFDHFFYQLGHWVATYPIVTLVSSLAVVMVCCLGFANFTIETDGEDLWVPANSQPKQHQEIVDSYFEDEFEYAVLMFESPSGRDGNLLTKDVFDRLWEINSRVLSLETDKGSTYEDLCTKELDGVTCEQPFRGVTRFWSNDFATYEAEVTDDEVILASINADVFPDGQAVNLGALFGNSIAYNDVGEVVGAAAMMQSYSVESDHEGEKKDEALAWQLEFIALFADEAEHYSEAFNVAYYAERSVDDALAESVTGEISLFLATYCIMVFFVTIVIGRCCNDSVRRRSWLGLGGVLLVVAAGLAAYGINSAFEVPFTSLSQVLPFILIGIGVDDMFVIVASFDQTDPSLEVEERVALALKRCGVSITYTSLTNFSAFMLGSLTLLPAVVYFCLYAGTAILFDFLLQMTAFVALVAMDAKRQKSGNMDWCCCCTGKSSLEQERMPRGAIVPECVVGKTTVGSEVISGPKLSSVGRWMRDRYTPFILSVPGKILVLLATTGLLATGIYGTTQATQGFDVVDLTPFGHYARDYTELAREYSLHVDTEYLPLNIYTREVDYPDPEVQVQIQATDNLMVDQDLVVGPITSWLTSFIAWAGTSAYRNNVGTLGNYSVYDDRDTFYEALMTFTRDGENARFQSDIVYAEDETVEISRTEMYLMDLAAAENNIHALKDARSVIESSTLEPEPFAFSIAFIYAEQYLVIYDELIANFGLALVAVAVLSALVLGRLPIVVLVCLTVVMIDIDLLGFVYHWGLEVNSITVIDFRVSISGPIVLLALSSEELIMAVGLVVDYMVHIVHYFLHQDPNVGKDARIANALGEIGPSVMLGASTTLLGIMPMAFAGSFIFRVFFRMFLIIIAFGFFHGMVFVPVALSALPMKAASSQTGEAISSSVKVGTETVSESSGTREELG